MVYFDLITSLNIVDGTIKYTGGTYFALNLLKEVLNKAAAGKIVVVFPKNFENNTNDYIDRKEIKRIYISSLKKLKCEDNSTIILPQVNGNTMRMIPSIKKNNSSVRIYAVLHDRNHNLIKFDRYDRYYNTGIRRLGIFDFCMFYAKRLVFSLIYPYCVGFIDKVITDSNYSMQKLTNTKVENINYYIPGMSNHKHVTDNSTSENYFLLVSGGRCEKNLLRTMEAFAEYKKESKSKLKFVATGVNNKVKEALLSSKKIKGLKEGEDFELFQYVTENELARFYARCKFVVFTSKGEGYGSPVVEAMSYGKVALASRITSVPEVAGSVAYYVDPFSVDSIKNGIAFLDDSKNLKKYEKYVIPRYELIESVSKMDTEILVNRLLE